MSATQMLQQGRARTSGHGGDVIIPSPHQLLTDRALVMVIRPDKPVHYRKAYDLVLHTWILECPEESPEES